MFFVVVSSIIDRLAENFRKKMIGDWRLDDWGLDDWGWVVATNHLIIELSNHRIDDWGRDRG